MQNIAKLNLRALIKHKKAQENIELILELKIKKLKLRTYLNMCIKVN
jgi:hypothetical protein